MRKNIWIVGGMLAVSVLLYSELRSVWNDTTDQAVESSADMAAAVSSGVDAEKLSDNEAGNRPEQGEADGKIIPAEFPQPTETIMIEDTAVPLSAAPVTEDSQDEEAQDKSVKSGQKETVQEEQQSRTQEDIGAASEFPLTDLGNGIYGYVDEQAALSLLTEVNGMRGEAPALSGSLNDIAKRRALSCIQSFSHNGMETAGECMARGQKDAAGAAASWKASAEHRMYIGDPAYTQAGTVCIRYAQADGSLQTIWVLVLN